MRTIKSFFKKAFHTPILLVFTLICVTILPPAINLRSLGFRSAIVVALGVDTDEEGMYILEAAATVPSTEDNLSETEKVLTSKGTSFSDALANMNIMFGKTIKLGHTKYVIIGKNISSQNLATALDGVIRTNKVRDSVQLILCEDSVHDLFNAGSKLKTKTGIKLSDILCYNEQYSTTSLDSNVDSFYKGYFSNNKISKINSIRLTKDYTKGVVPDYNSGTESSNLVDPNTSEQGGGKTGDEKYISNEGRVAVYKNGVLRDVLPAEISEGANWIDSSHLPKKLLVKTTSIDEIEEISFEVLKKRLRLQSFFQNNIPFISARINLTIDINEIINSNDVIAKNKALAGSKIKEDIANEIKNQIGKTINYSKQTKLDFLNFNDVFYLNNNKEYNEFLKEGLSFEDFIEYVQLSVEVNVKIV